MVNFTISSMQWHTLLALKGQHSSDFLYIFGKVFIYKPVVFEIIVVFFLIHKLITV